MILSDSDIAKRLKDGDLVIHPLVDPGLQIQPASVDLRLSSEFIVYRAAQVACLDPRRPETLESNTERIHVEGDEPFILHPGQFALGSTLERVEIPADLVARVDGRSSIGHWFSCGPTRSCSRTNHRHGSGRVGRMRWAWHGCGR